MSEMMKCPKCGRRFPFNPKKHQFDDHIYCPHCRAAIPNEYKASINILKIAKQWVAKKLEERRQKEEALKVLRKYFGREVTDALGRVRWEYDFPLRRWMRGERPSLSIEDVKMVVGDDPEAIANEVEWLEKLGVKVKGA